MSNENKVFVLSRNGKPLMPTTCRKARILRKQGKAVIVNYNPFTIQLNYPTGEATQPIDVGVDTNCNTIGVAVVSQDKVLHKSEINLCPGMQQNIKSRAALRKARRGRNTRYRKHHFRNRASRHRDMAPSSRNRLRHYITWIHKFLSVLPNCTLHIVKAETSAVSENKATPNVQQMLNRYGNRRNRVFDRDGHRCQICGRTNVKLRLHHIRFQSLGGRNKLDNLLTVCEDCHSAENHKKNGILDQLRQVCQLQQQANKITDYPLSQKILWKLAVEFPKAQFVCNTEVLVRCHSLNLKDTTYNKAIAATNIAHIKSNTSDLLAIKQHHKGTRILHNAIPIKGRKQPNRTAVRRNKNIPVYRGWYKNDMVRVFGTKIGFITGFGNFVACVKDINGNYITDPTRKNSSVNLSSLKLVCHNHNWWYQTVKCEE